MMLKELREKVYEANMDLPKHGLVVFTWGNASELDPETGLFVIKPSGVDYDELTPESLVVCDLDGKVVEGDLNPLLRHPPPTPPSTARGARRSAASSTRTPPGPSPGRRPAATCPPTARRTPTTSTAPCPACAASPRRRSRRRTRPTPAR